MKFGNHFYLAISKAIFVKVLTFGSCNLKKRITLKYLLGINVSQFKSC